MPAIRSTVLRLERQIQMDQAQGLAALHQSYEDIGGALLKLARERGYLGSDPLGALSHLSAPSPWDVRLAKGAIELWRTFFACFRADEQAFEAAHFQERAAQVQLRIDALGGADAPPELVESILATLSGLWDERHVEISQRLDQLIKELTEHQAKLGNADLARAHQSDEMARAVQVVAAAFAEFGEAVAPGTQPAELLARLIGRYRKDLAAAREKSQITALARRALVDALAAAASGGEPPGLGGEDQAAVDAVRRLARDRNQAEEVARQSRAQIARLQAEHRELMEEVASRDRRLARYEMGELKVGEEDERLGLYRQAFAEVEAGRDPKQALGRVRDLERIITVAEVDQQQALKILDRQLAEIAKCLGDLRRINPLVEDPKRYRPRLLMGSKYDFRTLPGLAQATRDAARDLEAYAERSRWAHGVSLLAKDLPKLQRVFKEMVDLVAAWREKLGDPPPASITIRIDHGAAIVSLPAILATDIEAVLRRRGKNATQASNEIVTVLGECVDLYRKSLERARGEPAPKIEGKARESANQGLSRLAAELTALGGTLDAGFGEAAADGFRLQAEDTALLADDHLLLLAVQQLDVACDVLAVLPGAPKSSFAGLPQRRDLDKVRACCRERVAWLEDVARYRFELRGGAAAR